MVLGSRCGSTVQMMCLLLLGVACGGGGLKPRLDAAPPRSGGTTASGGNSGAGGGTTSGGNSGTGGASVTGGSASSGGATAAGGSMATGGSPGATTTLGTGGASVDAPLADAPLLGDASYPLVDGPNGLAVLDPQYVRDHFDELVSGTWLIGWYGGQDHFSWLRITLPTSNRFDGKLAVLAEPSIPAGVPYWTCNGSASWGPTEKPQTLDLRLDAAGCAREIVTFDWFRPVRMRGKAFLEAGISAVWIVDGGYGESNALTGLKFPDEVCDAAFTACNAGF